MTKDRLENYYSASLCGCLENLASILQQKMHKLLSITTQMWPRCSLGSVDCRRAEIPRVPLHLAGKECGATLSRRSLLGRRVCKGNSNIAAYGCQKDQATFSRKKQLHDDICGTIHVNDYVGVLFESDQIIDTACKSRRSCLMMDQTTNL